MRSPLVPRYREASGSSIQLEFEAFVAGDKAKVHVKPECVGPRFVCSELYHMTSVLARAVDCPFE